MQNQKETSMKRSEVLNKISSLILEVYQIEEWSEITVDVFYTAVNIFDNIVLNTKSSDTTKFPGECSLVEFCVRVSVCLNDDIISAELASDEVFINILCRSNTFVFQTPMDIIRVGTYVNLYDQRLIINTCMKMISEVENKNMNCATLCNNILLRVGIKS
jgi:hypothetical protein